MAGLTGGVQGAEGSLLKGTFMGSTYIAGSWQDKLIETFAGTHDFIGGKLTGLYDDQGNIRRGMSAAEQTFYNKVVTTSAIVPSVPFAAAQGLPPEIWKAVAILLDYSK